MQQLRRAKALHVGLQVWERRENSNDGKQKTNGGNNHGEDDHVQHHNGQRQWRRKQRE